MMASEEPVSITISRESLFTAEVEEALTKQKALERLVLSTEAASDVSIIRRIVYSNLFYMPVFSVIGAIIGWAILEPGYVDEWTNDFDIIGFVFFPVICGCIVLFLILGDGIIRRTFATALKTSVVRGAVTFGLALVPVIIAGIIFNLIVFPLIFGATANAILSGEVYLQPEDVLPQFWSAGDFLVWMVGRSVSWTLLGASIGLGMFLSRGTTLQLQSAVLGGAIGGEIGGILFDSVDRFLFGWAENADASRFIGVCAVGLGVGIFVALSERLSREGWFRVRTGPLAGKAFVINRQLTTIGSTPNADIYLFKDAEIDPKHAVIHRIGLTFTVEDSGSQHGTRVNGALVQQRRLQSGDQIALGATILEFEERAKRDKISLLNKE